MKNRTAGTLSGCVIWIVVLFILSSCLLPIFFFTGSATSFSQYAVLTTGKFLCPAETTPQSYAYETTRVDEFGNAEPATGVELHCVDQNGTVVKNDPILYAFLWIGIFALIGLIISGVLAAVLAAPASLLITRFLNQRKNLTVQ